jgi:hypothetical protein
MAFPARLDPTQFNDAEAVAVKLTAVALSGRNEVQTITINATGGTFTITFNGQITTALAWNATAPVVQAALEALSTIGVGNIVVTLNALVYTLEFRGTFARTDVAAVTTQVGALTGGTQTAAVATAVPGAAGAATLAVAAVSAAIPAGSLLRFASGQYARTTADVAAGAVNIPVERISETLGIGDTAYYNPTSRRQVPGGTLIGRTYAERDNGTPWGPWSSTDDEAYLTYETVDDATKNGDVTLYRPTSLVKENYLPGWANLSAPVIAKIRALYQCIKGEG